MEPATGFSLIRALLAIVSFFKPKPRSAERDRAATAFRDELQRIRETIVLADPAEGSDPLPVEARRAAADVQRAVARFRAFMPAGIEGDQFADTERAFLDDVHETYGFTFDSAILPFATVLDERDIDSDGNVDAGVIEDRVYEQRQTLAGFIDRLREFASH